MEGTAPRDSNAHGGPARVPVRQVTGPARGLRSRGRTPLRRRRPVRARPSPRRAPAERRIGRGPARRPPRGTARPRRVLLPTGRTQPPGRVDAPPTRPGRRVGSGGQPRRHGVTPRPSAHPSARGPWPRRMRRARRDAEVRVDRDRPLRPAEHDGTRSARPCSRTGRSRGQQAAVSAGSATARASSSASESARPATAAMATSRMASGCSGAKRRPDGAPQTGAAARGRHGRGNGPTPRRRGHCHPRR